MSPECCDVSRQSPPAPNFIGVCVGGGGQARQNSTTAPFQARAGIAFLGHQEQPVNLRVPSFFCLFLRSHDNPFIPRQRALKSLGLNGHSFQRGSLIISFPLSYSFSTRQAKKICADAQENWVQNAMEYLDQKSKTVKS